MSETDEPLTCTTCGITRGYADAFVADSYETCTGGTRHDWTSLGDLQMDPDIDVV